MRTTARCVVFGHCRAAFEGAVGRRFGRTEGRGCTDILHVLRRHFAGRFALTPCGYFHFLHGGLHEKPTAGGRHYACSIFPLPRLLNDTTTCRFFHFHIWLPRRCRGRDFPILLLQISRSEIAAVWRRCFHVEKHVAATPITTDVCRIPVIQSPLDLIPGPQF